MKEIILIVVLSAVILLAMNNWMSLINRFAEKSEGWQRLNSSQNEYDELRPNTVSGDIRGWDELKAIKISSLYSTPVSGDIAELPFTYEKMKMMRSCAGVGEI